MKLLGNANHGTGDINLAAAFMAMGVPLKQREPVQLIHTDGGRSYGRFNLEPVSVCGKFATSVMDAMWNGAPTEPGYQRFTDISRFIRARPAGVDKPDDWVGYAISYFKERGYMPVPGQAHVLDLIRQFPDSAEAHILAFILNRFYCVRLVLEARHNPKLLTWRNDQGGAVMFDAHLPRHLQSDLLSRT